MTAYSSGPRALPLCLIGLGIAVLSTSIIVYSRASTAAASARTRLSRVASDVQTLADVQARMPAWATLGTDSADALTKRVSASLASAGLPATAMSSLNADAGSGQSSSTIQRRNATLVLTGVTLPQLGRWLSAWRGKEPAWTVAGIDMQPESGATVKSQPGADLPLRVVVTLHSLTLKSASPASAALAPAAPLKPASTQALGDKP